MTNSLMSFFKKLLDLREGAEDKKTIIENIKDDADVSSARFWTLVFAIGAASVGLNINSIPVIIGAMLISPLMGPIVSAGLALAINDWGLLRRSLRNFLTLTVISIVISGLYFALSPISNAQSELLARIQPTIFDVLIAIFGGMAGFIGISRARHNNVIPGVAIATALMPPLCTVGYGLATFQPVFIFGAFYLFLINSIFICLSSLVVARYLRLPKREYQNEQDKRKVNRIITVATLIIIAPAIYTAYMFVEQNNFSQNADAFITQNFTDEGHIIVYKNIQYHQLESEIELAFLGSHFSDDEISNLQAKLNEFDLKNTKLTIRQDGFALTESEWEEALDELRRGNQQIIELENELDSERADFTRPSRLLEEATILFPQISDIAIGEALFSNSNDNQASIAVVFVAETATSTPAVDQETITNWLRSRLENDKLEVVFRLPNVAPRTTAIEAI